MYKVDESTKFKIKDLPDGMIIYVKYTILGITGLTLDKMFDDLFCYKIVGNPFDYELCPDKFPKYIKKYISNKLKEVDHLA